MTAADIREHYLAALDNALGDLPYGVASEIRTGIAEELAGLDEAQTRERISHLGDPREIARAAAEEVGQAPAVVEQKIVVQPAPKTPLAESKGFAITAALVFAFGGFLVPVVGWIVGVVLVCMSRMWTRLEKIIAVATPFVVVLLAGGAAVLAQIGSRATEEPRNPLVPAAFDLVYSGGVLAVLVIPLVGGILLWWLRGRSAPPVRPGR